MARLIGNDIFIRNNRIGYVDDGVLYGLDAKGFAVRVDEINHRSEIIGKLSEWRDRLTSTRQAS